MAGLLNGAEASRSGLSSPSKYWPRRRVSAGASLDPITSRTDSHTDRAAEAASELTNKVTKANKTNKFTAHTEKDGRFSTNHDGRLLRHQDDDIQRERLVG